MEKGSAAQGISETTRPAMPIPADQRLFTHTMTVNTMKQRKPKPWTPPAMGTTASVTPEYFNTMAMMRNVQVKNSRMAAAKCNFWGVTRVIGTNGTWLAKETVYRFGV